MNYSKDQIMSYRSNDVEIKTEFSQEGSNSFNPLSTDCECQKCEKSRKYDQGLWKSIFIDQNI